MGVKTLSDMLIDLPENIEPGTEILVWSYTTNNWMRRIYVGKWNNTVYASCSALGAAYPYTLAKLELPPKTDWNKVPIGTPVEFWDDENFSGEKHGYGYLVAAINGVPFCSSKPIEMFTQSESDDIGGYSINSWKHVEIIEGGN